MPLYTLVNPTQDAITAPWGTFAPGSITEDVELTNAELRNAIRQRGAIVLMESSDMLRGGFTLLGTLLAGFSSPAQREQLRLKQGLQEYRDLLDALRQMD